MAHERSKASETAQDREQARRRNQAARKPAISEESHCCRGARYFRWGSRTPCGGAGGFAPWASHECGSAGRHRRVCAAGDLTGSGPTGVGEGVRSEPGPPASEPVWSGGRAGGRGADTHDRTWRICPGGRRPHPACNHAAYRRSRRGSPHRFSAGYGAGVEAHIAGHLCRGERAAGTTVCLQHRRGHASRSDDPSRRGRGTALVRRVRRAGHDPSGPGDRGHSLTAARERRQIVCGRPDP